MVRICPAARNRCSRVCRACPARVPRHNTVMLNIDLSGRRALVAGVADDGGFGFAIA
jgi:hypothetical protein